jgi:chromosome segregation ATPase
LEDERSALREENERLEAEAGKLALAQSQNAEFAETQQRLTAELSRYKSELINLKRDHSIVGEENQRLAAEAGSLRSNSDRAMASATSLNRELQEQIRIVKEELRNVSSERYELQRENRLLAAEISRIDRLERRMTEMYESRIWRTLVTLSSPFSAILIRRNK